MFNTEKIFTYNNGDELFTPEYAIKPLLKYVSKNEIIWECADSFNFGNITKIFRENGNTVISTSIHKGQDFFKIDKPNNVTMIITNPPWSRKNEFLERCYNLNIPFLLLLPIKILETKRRFLLYNKYGVQFMMFNKRISYIGSSNSPPFPSIWIGKDIFKKDIVLERI